MLDILTIVLVGSICGAESCVDIADFARDREALFREFLELPGGIPSHDPFSRLFRLLEPAAFADLARRTDGTHTTTDGHNGGRIEVRRHVVSHDIGWMLSDRRHPDG